MWGLMRRISAVLPATLCTLLALLSPTAGAQTQLQPLSASAARILPAPASSAGQDAYATAYAYLADVSRSFITTQTQVSANVISETFAAALQRSRDLVRETSQPIPEAVRQGLTPFYPAELLKDVRFAIGDTSQAGLAGFAIRNGNAAAVTLIDTIVFKDESFLSNLALWAHEMHHIQQYQDWGLSGFAARYAFGWNDVEAEADRRARSFVSWFRERTGKK